MYDIVKCDTGYCVVDPNAKGISELPGVIYRDVSSHYVFIRVSEGFDSLVLRSVLDVKDRDGITPDKLSERCLELLKGLCEEENLEVCVL